MKKSVTVVGAGFSGLVSAYYLVRAGYDVEVYEASPEAGGLITTIETPEGLVETAANALLNSKKVEDLFLELELSMQSTRALARRRYIFNRGRARRWPLKVAATFRFLQGIFDLIFFRESARPQTGESTHGWGVRVFGLEGANALVDGALQGIYAGDPTRLSAKLIFGPLLTRKTKNARPQIRGSVAPPNGMGQLVARLENYLKQNGVRFHYSTRYHSSINKSSPPSSSVSNPHPIVLATNPLAAAKILREVNDARASLLEKIEMSPLVSVTVFFEKTDTKTKGFGVLFPPIEKRLALGVLKNDFIFEGRSRSLFSETWIMGGALDPLICDLADEEILARIVRERDQIFGLTEKPKAAKITRWPSAVPHYTLDLEKLLPILNAPAKNTFLAGNYLGELGLAKILDRASMLPDKIATQGSWS